MTRAVHFEVVNGMNTGTCIIAMTQFMARSGKPLTIINDNKTNFGRAAREFKKCAQVWDQAQI